MRPSPTPVLVEHEGQWHLATMIDQVRSRVDGSWRVVVRFTTEPGSTYVLAMPADQCRPLAKT
jgi:hypothetical protein